MLNSFFCVLLNRTKYICKAFSHNESFYIEREACESSRHGYRWKGCLILWMTQNNTDKVISCRISFKLSSPFAITYRCDEDWGGLYCDEPEISLPTQLKDNFNRAPSNQNWLTVNGGKLSTVCGAVASGMALHFSGVGILNLYLLFISVRLFLQLWNTTFPLPY